MTRSRAYKKNDQAWIEQKNGASYGNWSDIAGWKALPPQLR
jgi:hypothetical protein